MKKDAFAGFLFIVMIILLVVFINTCNKKLSKSLDEIQNSADSLINKRIVIDKDTLIVIDYSFMDNNFTLSNGLKVNEKGIKNNIIK